MPLTDESDRQTRFSLEDLCTLTDMPRRTVRYYIQIGLVDRPEGVRRGAYYTRRHLEQLIAVRTWRRAGLSLERIRELAAPPTGAPPPPRPGDVAVRSHLLLRPGVELVIDPAVAALTPDAVRSLARRAAALVDSVRAATEAEEGDGGKKRRH